MCVAARPHTNKLALIIHCSHHSLRREVTRACCSGARLHTRRRASRLADMGRRGGCDGGGPANRSGGRGIVRAVQAALRKAQIDPRDIGHINAHGKSTVEDDCVE